MELIPFLIAGMVPAHHVTRDGKTPLGRVWQEHGHWQAADSEHVYIGPGAPRWFPGKGFDSQHDAVRAVLWNADRA